MMETKCKPMTRNSWTDYDGVSTHRGASLQNEWESPKQYVDECAEANPKSPLYLALSEAKLTDVDKIGVSLAEYIVDQIANDIADRIAADIANNITRDDIEELMETSGNEQ